MRIMPTKLLLAESDPVLATYIMLSLNAMSSQGFQVILSLTVADATRQLNRQHFDLVLLDMSALNGNRLECFEVLIELAPRALFIFLCSKEDVPIALQALRRGASDYVDKSLLNQDLLERVLSYNLASKRANNILRVSIAGIKAIGEACPLGIMMSDLSGLITYTNTAYQRLTGLRAEQLRGLFWAESIHPLDRLRIQREWSEVVQTQLPFQTWVRMLHQDLTTRHTKVNGSFLHDHKKLHGHVRILEEFTPQIVPEIYTLA
ncbi:PAS domain-containing protein [Alteromonas sp. 1_MG-2023]|uniref:PAS domain-containing protein n=1 Tax=Alteromonas sp. 1_MG-2023 TaxID=3062669 RepID=UPI0026E1332F|nr:PAS domain-containing protein [Alteromonas sp. 1_MG-2023]MDO6477923.1 PAS domain-containing protein [Alteromonas sp. 1_MG-2023]